MQCSGDIIRIRNSAHQDILIGILGTGSAFEGQKITVEGEYRGPCEYTTAMGSSRTVPSVR